MKIEIKKLSSELIDDYLHFFDTTPHDDELDEHKCYCVCWSGARYILPATHSRQSDFVLQLHQPMGLSSQ